ncbi:hypothetical protein [Streptomyces rochei]|uniref:hypothetical protein n=1 Tax=Streptomyces rochei TaxID=1928 RepID=UPI0036996D3E
MARTGPQKIPGASQAYFYGAGRYSGSDMEVNCGVVHTTEGMSLPSYNGGSMAPNVTGVPNMKDRTIRWYQHFDVDESARALANKLGGVDTNTANVFQIELVGTCDDKYKTSWSGKQAGVDYLHWPTAPEWALAEVAWLVRWLNQQHGIPLTCVKDWLAYGKDSRRPGITPASYGPSPARMSMSAWRSFKGWCGHQHVPENDHGDPGSMNFARVIELAKGTTSKPTQPAQPAQNEEESDVPRYLSLGMTKAFTLQPGEWASLAWDTEWADQDDGHPAKGQTFATGAHYNGMLHVRADGVARGDELQVRLVEDDASGKTVKNFPPTEVVGTSGDTYGWVPIVGVVGNGTRVKAQICHFGKAPITIERAEIKAHIWPL